MAKYFCKAKLSEDEETFTFQYLFVSTNLTATELAHKLSKQAKQCKQWYEDEDEDETISFILSEAKYEKPYYGFKLMDYDSVTMGLIESDTYFKMESYMHTYDKSKVWKEFIQWQVEIIRMDDINFIEM